MTHIPFHRASLGKAEERALCAVLRSGWIAKGPRTQELEAQFCSYTGARYALGVNSCTAGLHIALCALGVGKGDVVITTPVTFAATANVIEHTGARVRFVDIDPVTGNIDPHAVKKALTARVRAVIAVHLAGNPCDMRTLRRICREKKVFLIEDAAHALGASYEGKSIGTWGDIAAFSFYATKNMTTGEGGMVTTHNKKLLERMRVLSLHGLSADAWKRYTPHGRVYYDVLCAGFKYNMFDIQAALGLVQLERYETFLKRRAHLWALYDTFLKDIPEIRPLGVTPRSEHARHLYIVMVNTTQLSLTRDAVLDRLREKGVYAQVHFKALHEHTYYKKKYGFSPGDFPHAHQYSETCLSLPLYPELKDNEVQYVCNCLKTIVRTHRV